MGRVTEDHGPDGLKRLVEGVTNDDHRAVLASYANERLAQGRSPMMVRNDPNALLDVGSFLGDRRFEGVDRDTMAALLAALGSGGTERVRRAKRSDASFTETRDLVELDEDTISVRRAMYKAVFKLLRGTEDHPPEVTWFTTAQPHEAQRTPEDLFEPEQLKSMLQAVNDGPRTKEKALMRNALLRPCRTSYVAKRRKRGKGRCAGAVA